jgi:hypothetical protein
MHVKACERISEPMLELAEKAKPIAASRTASLSEIASAPAGVAWWSGGKAQP